MPIAQFSLDALLEHVLDSVLASPAWSLQPKGALFLSEGVDAPMALRVSRNISEPIPPAYTRMLLGHSVCGQVFALGEVPLETEGEALRRDHSQAWHAANAYCVPLNLDGQTLGVLVLFAAAKQPLARLETALFGALGSIVATLILRRRNGDELRLAEAVFRSAGEGIVITDAENRVIRVNRAFENITGYQESEVFGERG